MMKHISTQLFLFLQLIFVVFLPSKNSLPFSYFNLSLSLFDRKNIPVSILWLISMGTDLKS